MFKKRSLIIAIIINIGFILSTFFLYKTSHFFLENFILSLIFPATTFFTLYLDKAGSRFAKIFKPLAILCNVVLLIFCVFVVLLPLPCIILQKINIFKGFLISPLIAIFFSLMASIKNLALIKTTKSIIKKIESYKSRKLMRVIAVLIMLAVLISALVMAWSMMMCPHPGSMQSLDIDWMEEGGF